jgi:hypothetical protein
MAPSQSPLSKATFGTDSAPPALIKEESIPPGKTLYAAIDLAIPGKPPETGIFLPQGFHLDAAIDLAVYFHGFDQPGVVSIDQYFKADYGKLREGVNSSRRNVVLVAPTLGAHSQAGSLLAPGGIDGFVNKVLAAIRAYAQLQPQQPDVPDPFVLGSLVLACHSGGGAPVREIAGGNDRALTHLKASWGYDSLNSQQDVPFWSGWLQRQTSDLLRLYYLPNGTEVARRCEALGALGLRNLHVQKSNAVDHMHVPITHWQGCLEAAGFLKARPGVAADGQAEV